MGAAAYTSVSQTHWTVNPTHPIWGMVYFSGVGLLGRFAVKTDMKSGTKEAADTKGTRARVP